MHVPVASLRRVYDTDLDGFETTAELEDVFGIVGQPRAAAAVEFGTGISRPGFNIFAFGAPGTGKHSFLQQYLESRARAQQTPPDLCYVHNFDDPRQPRLVRVPAGQGNALRRDIERLAEDLRGVIAAAFESEDYQRRRHLIDEDFKERPERRLAEIGDRAKAQGVSLLRSEDGLTFAAMKGDTILSEEQFAVLPEDEQSRIEGLVKSFQEEVRQTIRQVPRWNRERRDHLRNLNREVATLAVEHPLDELAKKYANQPDVVAFLEALREHATEHAHDLAGADGPANPPLTEILGRPAQNAPTRVYDVSVLVDHSATTGAPVVYEDNPTYDNLIGRIEYTTQFGALVTDHTLIKAGALHRANGGYLLLDMHRLLRAPYAWDALKRALGNRVVRIEPLAQVIGLAGAISLDPEPAELHVQVVLMGDPSLYYLVHTLDPDFLEHFKVAADFDDTMPATGDQPFRYARLLATLCRHEGLRPLHRSAVARVMQYSSRLVDDQQRLSARIAIVMDLLREADYWAGREGHAATQAADVERAIAAQINRADRPRQHYLEAVARGTVLLATDGVRVGQINGLAVASYGTFAFGHPSRITARVRLGEGDVVNIEREVELSGPIHSKGVLILTGLLGARYAAEQPLAFGASLVFEQSYGPIDGDSASAAELFALLSAIADVPLRQDLAITGSINQHGDIQPIGGVNEKIEGFFDVCRARELTGTQGVIIPAANVEHLMLRQDIVDAVAAGTFHVHAIATADEGIALLTGLDAGARQDDGSYPAGTVNARVQAKLRDLAERRREFSGPPPADTDHAV